MTVIMVTPAPVRLEPIERPGTRAASEMENGAPGSVATPPVAVAGNPKKAHLRDPSRMVVAAGSSNPGNVTDENGQPANMKFFDYNFHAMKKGVSSALLDVALLMANASQMKSVYLAGPDSTFYGIMMALLIFSIVLQVIIGVLLIWLSKININDPNEKNHKQADLVNNIVVIGVFLLTVVNVFIASIGISTPERKSSTA